MRSVTVRTTRVEGLSARAAAVTVVPLPNDPTTDVIWAEGARRSTGRAIASALAKAGYPTGTTGWKATITEGRGSRMHELATALGVLAATDQLDRSRLEGIAAISAIEPDGSLESIRAMVSAAGETAGSGLRLLIPAEQAAEAQAGGAHAAVATNTLAKMIRAVRNETPPEPLKEPATKSATAGPSIDHITGAWHAKEAIEIAAAGRHPILLAGDAEYGQTRLAHCLNRLLDPPEENEQRTVLEIYSAAGRLEPNGSRWPQRPTQMPLASLAITALTGTLENRDEEPPRGPAYPGTLSLAHEGVLIIDNLRNWDDAKLHEIVKAAQNGSTTADGTQLPARFQLIAIAPGTHESLDKAASAATGGRETLQGLFHLGTWLGKADLEDPNSVKRPEREKKGIEKAVRTSIRWAREAQHDRYGKHKSNGEVDVDTLYARAEMKALAEMKLKQWLRIEGEDAAVRLLRIARTMADLKREATISGSTMELATMKFWGTRNCER